MNILFYIDPQTDAPHIYNHGVDEDEVEDVLCNPGEERPGIFASLTARQVILETPVPIDLH